MSSAHPNYVSPYSARSLSFPTWCTSILIIQRIPNPCRSERHRPLSSHQSQVQRFFYSPAYPSSPPPGLLTQKGLGAKPLRTKPSPRSKNFVHHHHRPPTSTTNQLWPDPRSLPHTIHLGNTPQFRVGFLAPIASSLGALHHAESTDDSSSTLSPDEPLPRRAMAETSRVWKMAIFR